MRHLKSREEFLKNKKIEESLTNNVRWGESLLGRMVNSTWRKVSASYRGLGIEKLAPELKKELLNLVAQNKTRDNPEIQESIEKSIEVIFVEEIEKILGGTETDDKKNKECLDVVNRYISNPDLDNAFKGKLNDYKDDLELHLQNPTVPPTPPTQPTLINP
jgi:hypothetical protein